VSQEPLLDTTCTANYNTSAVTTAVAAAGDCMQKAWQVGAGWAYVAVSLLRCDFGWNGTRLLRLQKQHSVLHCYRTYKLSVHHVPDLSISYGSLPVWLSIFNALTLLVGGRKGIRPVKYCMVRYWHGYLQICIWPS